MFQLAGRLVEKVEQAAQVDAQGFQEEEQFDIAEGALLRLDAGNGSAVDIQTEHLDPPSQLALGEALSGAFAGAAQGGPKEVGYGWINIDSHADFWLSLRSSTRRPAIGAIIAQLCMNCTGVCD